MDQFLHSLDWVLPLRQEWLTPIMKGITALGYTKFFFLALPILYWTWNKPASTRVATTVLFAGLLTFFLKALFDDPRPPGSYWIADEKPTSQGLPSGHTLISIVFWLSMAIELRTRWFTRLAVLLVILIPFSRLYLGVHDVEDIIGGAIAGFVILIVLRRLLRPERTVKGQAFFAFLLTFFGVILIAIWPASTRSTLTFLIVSFYVGWMLGFLLDVKKPFFEPAKGWMKPLAALLGLVIAGAIAWTMQRYLPLISLPETTVLAVAGIVFGFSITAVIPWLLARLKPMRHR